jgi:hypothetical protein
MAVTHQTTPVEQMKELLEQENKELNIPDDEVIEKMLQEAKNWIEAPNDSWATPNDINEAFLNIFYLSLCDHVVPVAVETITVETTAVETITVETTAVTRIQSLFRGRQGRSEALLLKITNLVRIFLCDSTNKNSSNQDKSWRIFIMGIVQHLQRSLTCDEVMTALNGLMVKKINITSNSYGAFTSWVGLACGYLSHKTDTEITVKPRITVIQKSMPILYGFGKGTQNFDEGVKKTVGALLRSAPSPVQLLKMLQQITTLRIKYLKARGGGRGRGRGPAGKGGSPRRGHGADMRFAKKRGGGAAGASAGGS